MQLLLWIAFTIVTPSAYGQCLCTFPTGCYRGDATFERSWGQIVTFHGQFFIKLNSSGLQYFKSTLKSETYGTEYWFADAERARICSSDCSDYEASYIPFPRCVPSNGTKAISQMESITTYERTSGGNTERYDVILNNTDNTICSPKNIKIGYKNLYENIFVDQLRDNSFYMLESDQSFG